MALVILTVVGVGASWLALILIFTPKPKNHNEDK